jgi:hypothetical protein
MIRPMTLRAAALLALVAFAVHEARYLVVPDAHADAGHGYLAAAPVLLALALALALGHTLVALARTRARAAAHRGPSWLAAASALLAIHAAQEGLERLLAGGGPIDAGLLVAGALCALGGVLVAALLRRAERLLREVGPPARARRTRIAAPLALAPRGPAPRIAASTGLARHLAGRAPPAFG